MSQKSVTIIVPPVWTGVYLNTARLLKYSCEDLGLETTIIEAGTVQRDGGLTIVLGWNLIPESIELHKPYILYQLEPLILDFWQNKLMEKKVMFQNASSIWDYTTYNIDYLNQFGLDANVLPLGYHPKLEEVSHGEYCDYDVLFVGFLTERRKSVIEELQHHCCVSIQPRWGKDFADALGRSKILLNIHQYDVPMPLEQPRISYALNNSCFVLSETSIDSPYQHLVTCTYENIVKETLFYLHNRDLRNQINPYYNY